MFESNRLWLLSRGAERIEAEIYFCERTMNEIAKSLGSITWAMSLLSAEQLIKTVTRQQSKLDWNHTSQSLDRVTRQAIDAGGSTVRESFDVVDRLQRSFIDTALGALSNPLSAKATSTQRNQHSSTELDSATNQRGRPANYPDAQQGWGPVPPRA